MLRTPGATGFSALARLEGGPGGLRTHLCMANLLSFKPLKIFARTDVYSDRGSHAAASLVSTSVPSQVSDRGGRYGQALDLLGSARLGKLLALSQCNKAGARWQNWRRCCRLQNKVALIGDGKGRWSSEVGRWLPRRSPEMAETPPESFPSYNNGQDFENDVDLRGQSLLKRLNNISVSSMRVSSSLTGGEVCPRLQGCGRKNSFISF